MHFCSCSPRGAQLTQQKKEKLGALRSRILYRQFLVTSQSLERLLVMLISSLSLQCNQTSEEGLLERGLMEKLSFDLHNYL